MATAKTTIDASVITAMLKDAQNVKVGTRPPEPEPVKIEVAEFALAPDHKSFKDLFGLKKRKSIRDHNIKVFEATDWDDSIQMLIPEVDNNYVFQPKEIEVFAVAMEQGDTTLISGPTGSGKSTMVEQYCAITRRPFIRINMTGDMESSAFFGSMIVRDGATVWVDGPVTEAVRYGAVILIDEWELSPPEITFGLQRLLEPQRVLMLKEKPASSGEKQYKAVPNFRIVCGGNTLGSGDISGEHAGTQVQNIATVDRFETTIRLNYLDKKHETQIIQRAVPDLPKDAIDKMLQFTHLIRTAKDQGSVSMGVSPRTLVNWGKKTMYWGDATVALTIAYLDKIEDSEKGEVIKLVKKVYGSLV